MFLKIYIFSLAGENTWSVSYRLPQLLQ